MSTAKNKSARKAASGRRSPENAKKANARKAAVSGAKAEEQKKSQAKAAAPKAPEAKPAPGPAAVEQPAPKSETPAGSGKAVGIIVAVCVVLAAGIFFASQKGGSTAPAAAPAPQA